MAEKPVDGPFPGPSPLAEIRRYALSGLFVSMLAAGGIVAIAHRPEGAPALEVDDAVPIDLAPVLVSSAPRRDVAEGPEQPASVAAVAAPQTEPIKPDKPPEDPKPAATGIPVPEKTVTPPRTPATAAPARDETGASGSDAKPPDSAPDTSEADRAWAAKVISRWQRTMLGRLEAAKSGMRTGGEYGTIDIVFSIDGSGRILSSRIQHGSGSARLDHAALTLIQRASPFPTPPAGLTSLERTFEVPIVFGRRHGAP